MRVKGKGKREREIIKRGESERESMGDYKKDNKIAKIKYNR